MLPNLNPPSIPLFLTAASILASSTKRNLVFDMTYYDAEAYAKHGDICQYCGNKSIRDERGNCDACGSPK